MPPTIVVVAGTSSNVGKTTLVCDLLKALPRWEAIKITRGHFRSCGKNPETCCVSHLLGGEPIVYSEPERTRAPGKDTARFWEAGASNVHWMIGTSDQVQSGVTQAIARVRSPGVIIEGTSVLRFLTPALSVLVVPTVAGEVKPSARRALREGRIHAVYISSDGDEAPDVAPSWTEMDGLPVFFRNSLPDLVAQVVRVSFSTSRVA